MQDGAVLHCSINVVQLGNAEKNDFKYLINDYIFRNISKYLLTIKNEAFFYRHRKLLNYNTYFINCVNYL